MLFHFKISHSRALLPYDQKLNCGQSAFSIVVTVTYIVFLFMLINFRRWFPIRVAIQMVTVKIVKQIPSLRIGFIVSGRVTYKLRAFTISSVTDLLVPTDGHYNQCLVYAARSNSN